MKHLLDFIPGYRSRSTRNIVIASVYYMLCILFGFLGLGLPGFVFFVSIPFIVFYVKDGIFKKSLKSLIPIPICLILFVASCMTLPASLSVQSIYLDYDTLTLDVADSGQSLTFSIQPQDAPTDGISFVSQNSSIAKIENQHVIPVKEGKTLIFAQTKDGKVTSNLIDVIVTDKEAEVARKEKREQNEAAAQRIIEKIAQIGEIDLLSGDRIDSAQNIYDSASAEVKQLVTNYSDLTSARQRFDTLVKEQKQRQQEEEEKAQKEAQEKARKQAEEKEKKEQAEKEKQKASSSTSKASSGNTSSPKQTSKTVYRGKTGNKYHNQTCPTLKGGGIPISLSDALAQGREPCKVCKP